MSSKEQIEEMQLVMLNADDFLYFNIDDVKANNENRFIKQATALYNAGYCRARDIVAEIFAEIEQIFLCGSNDELRVAVRIAELRKKYIKREDARNEKVC